jgi:O-succinylbenzoic acid--CoA ligase
MIETLNIADLWRDKSAFIDYCRNKLHDPHYSNWARSLLAFVAEWFDENDFVILHTSGSTGTPKPLKVKKQLMINSARMTLDYLKLQEGDRALLCLPVDYIAGKMMIVRSLVGNLNLVATKPRGNPLENIDGKFDMAAMIPLQVYNILNSSNGRTKIERIKKLLIGGGAIPTPLEEKAKELNSEIFSTYGMTETVSHIAMRRLNGAERSSYYTTMAGVTISRDENDCLVINAPAVANGTVETGDVVRIVDKDKFEILGRLDNVINSGGIKHNPEIIEKKIEDLIPDRFFISSVPDICLGNKIVLVIETSASQKYASSDFKNSLIGRLPEFERPKDFLFLESFPETGNSKINRKKITMEAAGRLPTPLS